MPGTNRCTQKVHGNRERHIISGNGRGQNLE